RLGAGEVGVEMDEVFADERRPRRQRRFLLGEDPECQTDREYCEDRDRDRVFAAPARLPAEGGAEVPQAAGLFFWHRGHGFVTVRTGGPGWRRPPFRFGAGLVSQRTSGFFGGRPPSCGWRPIGATAECAKTSFSVFSAPFGLAPCRSR